MKPLILASSSKARTELLAAAGVDHKIDFPLVDESGIKDVLISNGELPGKIAEALALAKASSVSQRHSHTLILGCDQVLSFENRPVDKSPTLAAARDLLARMRSNVHYLHSAAVLIEDGKELWRYRSDACLQMRDFSEKFLDAYLHAEGEAVLACIGCYRLEGLGSQLFENLQGDYFAILGLPLMPLLAALRENGVIET